MHGSDSTIKVPVDVKVEARGMATRDGEPAPRQSFAPVPRQLAVGDRLLNPGTLEVHCVTAVDDETVTFRVAGGTTTATWEDVTAACWLVVE